MSIKIAVQLTGTKETQSEHLFDKAEILIGRSLTNDVVLPDMQKKVSGKHAQIELKTGRYWITDLGSTNGTFLNQRRVTPKTPVELGNEETIGIGNFQLQFVVMMDTQGATQHHVDPKKVANALADELCASYALHQDAPLETRKEVLKSLLRERLQGVPNEEERSVLSLLQNRFGSGSQGVKTDADISNQEKLYRAGYTWMKSISLHFLGSDNFDSAEQIERFAKQIMQTIESTITWVSRSLKGRREFENEFSADLTMVFSKEGNPLKSAAGPSELGRYLLDWNSSRDLETTRDLLENAYKDLTMHQLGLVAGVQDCLKALLQQLDPKILQHSVTTENAGGFAKLLLTFTRSKKSWNKYIGRHQELFENNSKLFNELIYPELRKGYLGHHATEEAIPAPPRPPTLGASSTVASSLPSAPSTKNENQTPSASPAEASSVTNPTPSQTKSIPDNTASEETPSSSEEK